MASAWALSDAEFAAAVMHDQAGNFGFRASSNFPVPSASCHPQKNVGIQTDGMNFLHHARGVVPFVESGNKDQGIEHGVSLGGNFKLRNFRVRGEMKEIAIIESPYLEKSHRNAGKYRRPPGGLFRQTQTSNAIHRDSRFHGRKLPNSR